jgi:hypothetical protein
MIYACELVKDDVFIPCTTYLFLYFVCNYMLYSYLLYIFYLF